MIFLLPFSAHWMTSESESQLGFALSLTLWNLLSGFYIPSLYSRPSLHLTLELFDDFSPSSLPGTSQCRWKILSTYTRIPNDWDRLGWGMALCFLNLLFSIALILHPVFHAYYCCTHWRRHAPAYCQLNEGEHRGCIPVIATPIQIHKYPNVYTKTNKQTKEIEISCE